VTIEVSPVATIADQAAKEPGLKSGMEPNVNRRQGRIQSG
jgi:hypothetical protein